MSVVNSIRNIAEKMPYSSRRFMYRAYERFIELITKPVSGRLPVLFVVGSQRSGTTLLGLILDSHPDIKMHEEEDSYALLKIKGGQNVKLIEGFKIPVWTSRYRFLKKAFPHSKVVYLRRDLRSIVSSMLRLKSGSLSCVSRYGWREIERSISFVSDLRTRNFFLKTYSACRHKNDEVTAAALCAYLKMYLLEEYFKIGLNVLECWYEDLVIQPENETRHIFEFLGLKWSPEVLHHHEKHEGIAIGGTRKNRPIDVASTMKWQSQLTEIEKKKIDEFDDSCRLGIGECYFSPFRDCCQTTSDAGV